MLSLKALLELAITKEASDLHLKVGSPPYLRIDGELVPQLDYKLTDEQTEAFLDEILNQKQREKFDEHNEIDLAYSVKGLGRFRTTIFRQRGATGIVMRRIKANVPNFEELHLPEILKRVAELRRGLVLVTGTTGSGKSTSLAAMIEYINERRRVHIMTLEDPIEYLHSDKKAIINQREVTIDTETFSSALKVLMRQDPDVILIGEMRDIETFQAAISASETGHLVFSTLHTSDAMQTIDRIVDLFPPRQHNQVRSQLSLNLKAVVSQRLLPRADEEGRVPAVEVMLITPPIRKLIKDNRIAQIPTAIQASREEGNQTFNDSLKDLVMYGLVTEEEAMLASDHPEELAMNLQGVYLDQSRGGIIGLGH
jgi:twitching motility protein PilT